jgi:methionyl-tRNA formyltransferase
MSLHQMTPKPDAGAVLAQTRLDIDWDETALSLTQKAAQAGRNLVRSTVPRIVDGTAPRIEQQTLGPTSYFGGRTPADSRLDFAMSVGTAFDQIRAVADPWPNAFLETARGTVKVAWAIPSTMACPQGSFRVCADGVLLGFDGGAIRVHALRRAGVRSERPTEHASWLRELGINESLAVSS